MIVFEVRSQRRRVIHRFGAPAESVSRVEQLLGARPQQRHDGCGQGAGRDSRLEGGSSPPPRLFFHRRSSPPPFFSPLPPPRTGGGCFCSGCSEERTPRDPSRRRPHLRRSNPGGGRLSAAPKPSSIPERRRALQTKRSDHAFACLGRVAIKRCDPRPNARPRRRCPSRSSDRRGAGRRHQALERAERPVQRGRSAVALALRAERVRAGRPARLAARRSAAAGHPARRQPLAAPDPRIKTHGRVIGQATAPGEDRQLGLSIDDARQHLHVIGPTGTGKSTLLANLICQDIAAGRGVVVIEPKGDLIEDVLARIPEKRLQDVVVLDPTETDYPIGLNPLLGTGAKPGAGRRSGARRLPRPVRAELGTADAGHPARQPADAGRPRRRHPVRASGAADQPELSAPIDGAGVDDPIALEPFWAWFEAISDAERQQAIAPVLNKLRPFLLRKSVRAIVGQLEPRFRIDEVFTKRKIVLVSLAKGLIGPEAAALLGSLFVAELWQAVLGRAAHRRRAAASGRRLRRRVPGLRPPADRHGRRSGPGARARRRADAGASAPRAAAGQPCAPPCWRTPARASASSSRARTRRRWRASRAGCSSRPTFSACSRFEAYAQLVADGQVTDFASIRTRPLPAAVSDPGLVREASRQRYGRPVAEVEAEILRLVDPGPDDEGAVGRRRRGE